MSAKRKHAPNGDPVGAAKKAKNSSVNAAATAPITQRKKSRQQLSQSRFRYWTKTQTKTRDITKTALPASGRIFVSTLRQESEFNAAFL